MTKKDKKEEAMDEEYSDEKLEEELSEGEFIEDLKDNGEPKGEEVQDEVVTRLMKIEETQEKQKNAITVNQKYLKKIWERVKELEDNFKLLCESK